MIGSSAGTSPCSTHPSGPIHAYQGFLFSGPLQGDEFRTVFEQGIARQP